MITEPLMESNETGEITYDMTVDPQVNLKFGGKGKMDCDKKKSLVQLDRAKIPMIASNQIDMDELLKKGK